MPRLSLDLDDATYSDFSKKCIDERISKSKVLRGLIKKWINKK